MTRILVNNKLKNVRYKSTGANALYNILLKNNFEYAFGYSGGAILPFLNEFINKDIKFIMNRNEQCSGHAAAGYAKSSGKIGLVVSTSGPGVTNLVTPLYDALTDGVPILALTGQVPTGAIGTDAFQECKAVEITKSSTKWSYQLKKDDNFEEVIDYAMYLMNTSRKGPVHIDLPKDIMSNKYNIKESKMNNFIIPEIEKNYDNSKNISDLINLINVAHKPVIIAGNGCLDSYSELRECINKTKIPITSTYAMVFMMKETREFTYVRNAWISLCKLCSSKL